MQTERRQIVLSAVEADAALLDRVEGLAIRIQVETGLLLDRGPSETRASGIVRHAWRERPPCIGAKPAWLILTVNPEVPACWLEVLCEGADLADRLARLARQELGAPGTEELRSAALAEPRAAGAITRFALGAPGDARPSILLAVRAGLVSAAPAARMDAALAAVTAGLSESRPDFERAAAAETDAEVAATLRWAADTLGPR